MSISALSSEPSRIKFELPNGKWTDGKRERRRERAIRNGAAGGAPEIEGEGKRTRKFMDKAGRH